MGFTVLQSGMLENEYGRLTCCLSIINVAPQPVGHCYMCCEDLVNVSRG